MSLYTVSVLHHDLVDYLVSVFADGRVIVIEREAVCTWYKNEVEHGGEMGRYIYMTNVVIEAEETAKGALLPLRIASQIGAYLFQLPAFALTNILRKKTRGERGIEAEQAFCIAVDQGCFAPTFEEIARKATEDEDRVDGIDFFVNGEAGTDIAVQVKFDGRAHQTGNIFIQTETAPITHAWSQFDDVAHRQNKLKL